MQKRWFVIHTKHFVHKFEMYHWKISDGGYVSIRFHLLRTPGRKERDTQIWAARAITGRDDPKEHDTAISGVDGGWFFWWRQNGKTIMKFSFL